MVASMRSAGSPFLDNTAGMVWNLVLERRSTPPTWYSFFERSSICRRWRKRPSGTFTGFTPRGNQVAD